MEKSCKIWVWHVLGRGLAIFWLNHGFWLYNYNVHTKMDFFIIYELSNDDEMQNQEPKQNQRKIEKFLHSRAEKTHLSAIGSDQQYQKRSWHAQPKRDFYWLLPSMSSWNNYFDAVKKENYQIKSLFHRRSVNILDSFFSFLAFLSIFWIFSNFRKNENFSK